MEQIHQKTRLRHVETKEVINGSQCGFIKDESTLTKALASYNRVAVLMGKGRAKRLPKRCNIDKIKLELKFVLVL